MLEVSLTFTLLELREFSLCYQYRARFACISVQSDQALYFWLANNLSLSLDTLYIDNGQLQWWKVD